ncbi:hypothetical protein BN2497_633 [Janthinobacterium sp. CG23_2]|nr:hypothetical protein BN2497_633 [Janthinobacterium sp. CG23_2]CUU26714.1 hypothetical protein BN3177_633 [Janthinobacterium sp. CG23_2]
MRLKAGLRQTSQMCQAILTIIYLSIAGLAHRNTIGIFR